MKKKIRLTESQLNRVIRKSIKKALNEGSYSTEVYSKWLDMEYVAVVLDIVFAIVWSIVVRNDFIYKRMAMSVWIGVLVLSFGYLIYCVKKSQYYCGLTWEERTNGITV